MLNVFIVAFSYVAALVGAGFASGQEIISFFVKYGKMSILGVLGVSLIFGTVAAAVCAWCVGEREYDYNNFLGKCTGKKFAFVTRAVTLIFSLAVFCVMASGCGEMGYALFGWDIKWGILAICVSGFVIFLTGTDSAMEFNAVLGAVVVVGIITVCLYIITYREHQTFSAVHTAVSSLSYAGYNMITAPCVLVPLSRRLKTRSDAVSVGIVSACAMFFMMILMWFVLAMYYGKINLGEIPMLTMAMRQNKVITLIYSVLLLAALLSTAVSNGISCINIMSARTGRILALSIVLGCGLFFSGAGFSNLIDKVYRLCGYAGIFLVGYTLIKILKNIKNIEKQRK